MMTLYQIIISFVYGVSRLITRDAVKQSDPLWLGRFGMIESEKTDIWMHAASVGEIKVISELVRLIRDNYPSAKLHITAMTRTGYATAKALYPGVTVSFFPFDHPSSIKKTIDALNPTLVLIAETEIWPNLIKETAIRNIPLVLINGRMSKNSFSKYRWIKKSLSRLLETYDHLFVKTELDKKHYAFFQTENRPPITIAGDMKFDSPLTNLTDAEQAKLRKSFHIDPSSILWVCGSTRPGEETILLQAFKKLKPFFPDLRIILAPRHVERVDEVCNIVNEENLTSRLIGEDKTNAEVIIVDRIGLLANLYALAKVSFVGGTLVDIGGHNLLEPVWSGSPVCFGPYIDNVLQQAAYIKQHQFGAQCQDREQLITLLKKILLGDILLNKKTSAVSDDSATRTVFDYIRKNHLDD